MKIAFHNLMSLYILSATSIWTDEEEEGTPMCGWSSGVRSELVLHYEGE